LGGMPALGRRLIDRGLISTRPLALGTLARYRQVLTQKRELLASGNAGSLPTWNELLAPAAAELVALRAGYVSERDAALSSVRERTALGLPPLRLEYLPSPRAAIDGAAATLAALERVAAR